MEFTGRDAIPYARFSSDQQSDGSSLERQGDVFESFIVATGVNPRRDLAMDDKGKSAFTGKNVLENGALGNFIYKLEQGELVLHKAPLPLLVVEEVDRLTRLEPDDGEELLLRLMRYVDVCVVEPNGTSYQVFSRKGNGSDIGSKILLILKVYGAHDYSKKLSKRIGDASKRSLTNAVTNKTPYMSGSYPFWLSRTKEQYTVVQKWVDIVIDALELVASGLTPKYVAAKLNEKGYPTPSKKRIDGVICESTELWSRSRVVNLYKDNRVMGYMTSSNLDKPLLLYPPIVSETLFNQVLSVTGTRTVTKRQRTRKITSIFDGLSYCFECGSKMYTDIRKKNGVMHEIRIRCASKNRLSASDNPCSNSNMTGKMYEPALLELISDKLSIEDFRIERDDTQENVIRSRINVLETNLSEFDALLETDGTNIEWLKAKGFVSKKLNEQIDKLKSLNVVEVREQDFEEVERLKHESLIYDNTESRQRMNALLGSLVSRIELFKSGRESNMILIQLKNGARRMYLSNQHTDGWHLSNLDHSLERQ